jgi:hypothetical protein
MSAGERQITSVPARYTASFAFFEAIWEVSPLFLRCQTQY